MIETILLRYFNTGVGQPNQNYNGNQYPNQPNIAPNRPSNENQYTNQFNHGNQYPNQPNYSPNSDKQNQGAFANQNNVLPSVPTTSQTNVNQGPNISPSGVGLAPFPDVNSNSFGGRNQFNYDNPQNRPISTDANNRYNNNGNVPLAGYSGAHVPLA